MTVLLAHLTIAAGLFFAVNWLGRHAESFGYYHISFMDRADYAPGFNVVYRILTPIVGILLAAAVLYAVGLDALVGGIWHVAVYYVALRILFNLVTGRNRLINWPVYLGVHAVVIIAAWFLYREVIQYRNVLFPDLTTIGNELWLLTALFLFHLFNRAVKPAVRERGRRVKYIVAKYRQLRERFGSIVREGATDLVAPAVYAVMVFEDFNRPAVFRTVERVLAPRIKKTATIGVMQVETEEGISDEESVRRGTEKLQRSYEQALANVMSSNPGQRLRGWHFESALREAVASYNPDYRYVNEVMGILEVIREIADEERPQTPSQAIVT